MDEMIGGNYGGLAARNEGNRSSWYCTDSDYVWTGVVDDFGNIVLLPGTDYINMRSY